MSKLRSKLSRLTGVGGPAGARPLTEQVDGDEARTAPASIHDEGALLSQPGFEAASPRVTKLAALRTQMAALSHKLSRERARHTEPLSAKGIADPFLEAALDRCGVALPGELEETPHGLLRRVCVQHDEDHRHGSIPVALALEACGTDLAILALDPTLEAIDFSRALYIDTETTGLAGGAGTLPFLIGLAWFEGQRLWVEQLLLERPGQEVPMLQRLGQALSEASCIISYNGKSFDWPLLRTRFILNRVAAPKVPAHLDLLHCARRVYKRRLGAVRLVNLEESILGFERVDDMPGELIPQTYLGYLRGHVPGSALQPILDHNRSDLVALAAILGELVRRFRGEHARQDARDHLGFASVAARAADHERAIAFAHAAAEADVRGELAPDAYYLAGELKARAHDYSGALQAFTQSLEAAATDEERAARAHLALAKLWEHKFKDATRALGHAVHTAPAEGESCCARRVARLQRKLGSLVLPFVTDPE